MPSSLSFPFFLIPSFPIHLFSLSPFYPQPKSPWVKVFYKTLWNMCVPSLNLLHFLFYPHVIFLSFLHLTVFLQSSHLSSSLLPPSPKVLITHGTPKGFRKEVNSFFQSFLFPFSPAFVPLSSVSPSLYLLYNLLCSPLVHCHRHPSFFGYWYHQSPCKICQYLSIIY